MYVIKFNSLQVVANLFLPENSVAISLSFYLFIFINRCRDKSIVACAKLITYSVKTRFDFLFINYGL